MALKLSKRKDGGDRVPRQLDTDEYNPLSYDAAIHEIESARKSMPARLILAFTAGKGGVGKTSSAVNCAGIWAAAGWNVLLIETDPQRNAHSLLGLDVAESEASGESLLNAVVLKNHNFVKPLAAVRDGIDFISLNLQDSKKLMDFLAIQERGERADHVRAAIGPLAEGYDIVVIDSRPVGEAMGEIVMNVATDVIIPVRIDRNDLEDSLRLVAEQHADTKTDAVLLGAFFHSTDSRAKRLFLDARARAETTLGDLAPVLQSVVFASNAAVADQTANGLLVAEAATAAEAVGGKFWETGKYQFSTNIGRLARDYANVTAEITRLIGKG